VIVFDEHMIQMTHRPTTESENSRDNRFLWLDLLFAILILSAIACM
jgi:hypothetical protein